MSATAVPTAGRLREVTAMAQALAVAEASRTPIPPLTRTRPFLDLGTAYAVQALRMRRRLEGGERLVGAKLGLTTKVARAALGIGEPVHGLLTSGMVVPFGAPVRAAELIRPRVEPELALVLGRPLDRPVTVVEALAAVEAVVPALEVVDTRYDDRFAVTDSVADDAGAARVVLGARPRHPRELEDLALLGCVFTSPGGTATAAAGEAMGHPAGALAWLASDLAARGDGLPAGSVVLTGGLTAAAPLTPGTVVTAEFDGLGAVSLRCV